MNSLSSYEAATERLCTGPEAARALRRPGKRQSILLIEDSLHMQNLVKLMVTQGFPGVELNISSDGVSGLVQYGRERPDALIVDIMLPGIDGALLIASLRSESAFDHDRLIVVTSLDDTALQPYAWALDGLAVLHKRNLITRLPLQLARVLRKSGSAEVIQ